MAWLPFQKYLFYKNDLSLTSFFSFQTEVDVIEDVEEYQTIPGVIILVLRVVVMLCFLVALRETMMHEFTQVRGRSLMTSRKIDPPPDPFCLAKNGYRFSNSTLIPNIIAKRLFYIYVTPLPVFPV